MNKKQVILVALVIISGLSVAAFTVISNRKNETVTDTSNQNVNQSVDSTQPQPQGFNKNLYKLDEPGSLWWVVNKIRPLPDGYIPDDLAVPNVKLRLAATAEQMQFSTSATPALIEMFDAAKQDGIELVFGSGYRSEALQRQFYNQYVAQDGQSAADRYSARPGTSEHQTGLSFDATASNGACHLEKCFATTPEGDWLVKNAHKFGFIVRYVEGKESVTGYDFEPWHMRYVGEELSTEMHTTGIQTLEEFFGLPPAPGYLN